MEKTNLILPEGGREVSDTQLEGISGGSDSSFITAEYARLSEVAVNTPGWRFDKVTTSRGNIVHTEISDGKSFLFSMQTCSKNGDVVSAQMVNASKPSDVNQNWDYLGGSFIVTPM
ncbi:MAG: hypothetical protein FWB72_00150 [Firmicutes bacterium]|nr:hypothetical protein [Bacillota bacterium]